MSDWTEEDWKKYRENFKIHHDSVKDRIPEPICSTCLSSEPTDIEGHMIELCEEYFVCVFELGRIYWTNKDKTLCVGCNFYYRQPTKYFKDIQGCSRQGDPCTINKLFGEND